MATPARDREALEQAVVRGSELLKQGKTEPAQRAFRAALELEPDNPRVLALLGLSHFRANELSEARPIYEQLVERAPTDASHRLNLGLVYLKQNDADRAIDALEASRALDPSQGRAVSYLGLAYARAGRYAEAYRAFLVAGQNDLAIEIEANLSHAERERIHAQIGRTPQGLPPDSPGAASTALPRMTPTGMPRVPTPPMPFPSAAPPPEPSPTLIGAPRTKPPSAPPAKRNPSGEHPAAAAPTASSSFGEREPGDGPHLFDDMPTPGPAQLGAPLSPAALRAAETRNEVRKDALKMTESMQFVMPKMDPAAPAAPALDGASMISRAVASATPSVATAVRTRSGGLPPRPLSELATDDLVRPDEGDDAFEIGANGAMIIRITDRVLTRLDGVHATGGDLSYELAMRRSRGHNTDEAFNFGGAQLHAVTGRGYLIVAPAAAGAHWFTAVSLDDDILYLREDLVFAFQASLRWENGNVPGLRGKLPVVQFRGNGALALRLVRPLVRVKLPAQGLVFIDAERLAGWIGRVIPRAVVPPPGGPLGAMCVECTGEGIVLVEPAPPAPAVAAQLTAAPRLAEPAPPPPPPAASAAPISAARLLGLADDDESLDQL